MLRVQYDTNSPYHLRFPHPQERDAIVKLAEAFVAYEQSRPSELQTPYLPLIADLLQQVQANHQVLEQSKSNRTIASDSIKQLDQQLAMMTRQIWLQVSGYYETNPAKVVNWGLVYNRKTGNVIMPQGRPDRLALLRQYIAWEEQRDEAVRFDVPDLAEAIRLRDTFEFYQAQYQESQQTVSARIRQNKALTELILKHLQSAAVHLLAFQFDYKLGRALQNWGFDIVERR